MDLTGFYVLISRVRTVDGLRLLYRDDAGIAQLKTLQWKPQLGAWVQGYDDSGRWGDAQAAEAFKTVYAAQAASKERHKQAEQTKKKEQKAKAKATSGGKCKAPAESRKTTKKRKKKDGQAQKNEEEKAKAKKRKAPPPRGASRSSASVPGGAFDELAMELQLHGQWADVKELMRKGFGPERDRPLPGYSPDQFNLTHQDLSTLWPGTQVLNEAINEMGRRLVTSADSMVFYNSFALERLYPLNLRANEIPVARPLTRKWFSKMAGGFGRKLGIDVKVLVAAQYVPGHYCLAFVDFERENFMYTDP